MTINFKTPDPDELSPRITVLGVGGAGGNAVNNMINAKLEGVSFVVANTDAQALTQSKADHKIQLGAKLTEGLGAGAKPEVGRGAAEESLPDILDRLSGAHMVFITAGMGGGTGTGAAPVIARAVRELGILTVGVVTKPFHFEGDKRMRIAERGIEELQNYVDTLIVIPNQNLFRVATERTTFAQAFAMADDVLHSGVRGVTDLIIMPGLINRDFADIKTVMSEMGKAMMGTGEMDGEGRALRAAEAAISNPLLDDVSMKGARAVLVNVTGGPDLMLFEVDEAVNRIRAEVDPDANILFGSALSEDMEGRVRVSVVATGIDAESCVRMGDNVQKLPVRRKAVDIETPAAPATSSLARAVFEPIADSTVREQMATLAQELASRVEAPLPEESPAPAPAPVEEPMNLSAAPIEEPVAPRPLNIEFPRGSVPQEPERRGIFGGLFGGRRRAERNERMVEPSLERPRAPVMSPAVAQPIARTAPVQAPPAAPQPAREAPQRAAQASTAETPQKPQGPADDLFAGVAEDDRFEIPAFLRRQAKTGS
ncbi:MAG TPA: cell division protein FtsZ [Micropepsaceae bacterium]|nr:cell division protein FtsZ [Micropepsaceae bacterium]